jgi:hypothetical protein
MDFQRTPGPIGDPFLDTVHRRHPDVDIVVLPDPRADVGAPTPVLPADADSARVERADARTRLTALWRALHEDPDAVDPSLVAARLAPGPVSGTVVATAQTTARLDPKTPDGRRMLSRLAGALDGWDVQRFPGPVERLVASRDGASLRATYAEPTGVLVVVLTGPTLGVGTADAHALVGEA